jgi:hypothetical protein
MRLHGEGHRSWQTESWTAACERTGRWSVTLLFLGYIQSARHESLVDGDDDVTVRFKIIRRTVFLLIALDENGAIFHECVFNLISLFKVTPDSGLEKTIC